ncbi:DNA polymerase lambda [Hondaea fermentalgiana]|uniref:DNA polymerase n=1 Tax=Hondaea fermentalgiana TaxID=2315210 RepID=A0A2R5GJU9_9STRA|nr:DNA polymerase lambda [Hondaea fermentalgiana]|eukprot:GBG31176.1 DNA polymerase lambda [Hondaea fermentalgiana]
MKVAFFVQGRDVTAKYVALATKRLEALEVDHAGTNVSAPGVTHVVASLFAREAPVGLDKDVQIVTLAWLQYVVSKQGHEPSELTAEMDWRRCKAMQRNGAPDGEGQVKSAGADFQAWVEMRLSGNTSTSADGRRIPSRYLQRCNAFVLRGKYLGLADFPPSEIPRHDAQPSKKRKRYDAHQGYACFKSGTIAVQPNLNEHLTNAFQPLVDYYEIFNDEEWRKVSFKRVIDLLRSLKFKVTSADQLRSYRGIGPKVFAMIDEALRTGYITRAKEVWKSDAAVSLRDLQRVHGIGATVARDLHKRGIRSVAELREHKELLNSVQLIGLEYLDDIEQRIPRAETGAIGKFVEDTARALWPSKALAVETCGSYRRGKSSSGDVDVILTTPDQAGCPPLADLIAELHARKFIAADLTQPKDQLPVNRQGQVARKQTYMGICKLPGYKVHRRLDVKFYPREQFPFALLYFTGNDHFNRSMRNFAKRKGWSMSDEGIFSAQRQRSERIAKASRPVDTHFRTEKDVFDWLGFPYKHPTERNCYDVTFA